MSNPNFRNGGSSSSLTEYRKNRMIYANFLIQQQNQNTGCKGSIGLQNGGIAEERIIPVLKTGALFTSVADRDAIIKASVCSPPLAPSIFSVIAADSKLIVLFEEIPYTTAYFYSIDGGVSFVNAGTTSSPMIITGLTNSTQYSVVIRAANNAGTSQSSTSASGTPSATLVTFTTVETTSWTAPSYITSIEYLVVAGGGGSGGGYDTGAGAGGGGGMVLSGLLTVIPGTSYTVTVGDGGAAGISIRSPASETQGGSGENSVFGSVVALGGGGGWPSRQPAGSVNGNGGAAAVNPSTASKGGNGGGSVGGGGGGGGSSAAGTNKSGTTAGEGGAGTGNSLSGSLVQYGVGGNGGTGNTNNAGVAGTSNRGNGAKGGGAISGAQNNGAKGGSGIVILKY